jgi:hypothetical protein
MCRILGRGPTSSEVRDCRRSKAEKILPSGTEDESFAKGIFDTEGRLPNASDWKHDDLKIANGGHAYYVGKARVVRTDANPSMRQIENSTALKSKWGSSIWNLIDRGIERKFYHILTDEEVANGDHKFLSAIWIRSTKADGELRIRLAPHGDEEPDSTSEANSTASSCPSMDAIKFALAAAAFLDLTVFTADVKDAQRKHNRIDNPACKNPRKITMWLTPFQAQSDQPRALGLDNITNGLKDASSLWRTIATRVLFKLRYLRSSGSPNFFTKHLGEQGLAFVVKQADDDLQEFSRDSEENLMEKELEAAEQNAGWTMTRHDLDTAPMEQGIPFCGMSIR